MRVVFTNGCFDVLHVGHVRLLQYAKSRGNYLIVGLNSDASVKLLKGDDRPINKCTDRKEILESLGCVDEVIVFYSETPYDLIKQIKPTIIVKGEDWKRRGVVGSDIAHVEYFPYKKGYSTTDIIEKIRR